MQELLRRRADGRSRDPRARRGPCGPTPSAFTREPLPASVADRVRSAPATSTRPRPRSRGSARGAPDTPGWTLRVVPNKYPIVGDGVAGRARSRDLLPRARRRARRAPPTRRGRDVILALRDRGALPPRRTGAAYVQAFVNQGKACGRVDRAPARAARRARSRSRRRAQTPPRPLHRPPRLRRRPGTPRASTAPCRRRGARPRRPRRSACDCALADGGAAVRRRPTTTRRAPSASRSTTRSCASATRARRRRVQRHDRDRAARPPTRRSTGGSTSCRGSRHRRASSSDRIRRQRRRPRGGRRRAAGCAVKIRVGITIDAPPADTWRIVEPIEHHVDWMADAESIRFTGAQTRGVGTTFDCVTKVGPIRLTDRMTVTEWEPGEDDGHRAPRHGHRPGPLHAAAAPRATARSFTWTERLTFPWWMGGAVGAFAAKPVLRAIWRRNLRRLKTIVEARMTNRAVSVAGLADVGRRAHRSTSPAKPTRSATRRCGSRRRTRPKACRCSARSARSRRNVGIGTGVLALQLRTPPLHAMAAATLQQLAGDRDVFLGVGISSPAVAGQWHGAGLHRPARSRRCASSSRLLRECLTRRDGHLRGRLLHGEAVPARVEARRPASEDRAGRAEQADAAPRRRARRRACCSTTSRPRWCRGASSGFATVGRPRSTRTCTAR